MRPLGSIAFGHIGDRLGRRRMLIVSSLAMACATCVIGLLPTHASIGAAAGILMVALRLVQGLSVGGEYVGSAVFLAERAPQGRRGLYASFSAAGLMAGLLLGSGVGALVSALLSEAQIAAWGWRLPFLAGLLLGLVALLLRLAVAEVRLPQTRARVPVAEAFSRHGGAILYAAALYAMPAAIWYIAVIYLPVWLVRHRAMAEAAVLEINAANLAVLVPVGLWAAAAADRIGRRPVALAAAIGLTVLILPLFWVVSHGGPAAVAISQGVLVVVSGIPAFVLPAVLAELFPWRVRATAANLSLNVTFAIVGGTGPMIATWLVAETGGLMAVAVYLTALGIVSAFACAKIKDRRGVPLDWHKRRQALATPASLALKPSAASAKPPPAPSMKWTCSPCSRLKTRQVISAVSDV
jgi:MHS family proline/betaine transporter-like MFS transporter